MLMLGRRLALLVGVLLCVVVIGVVLGGTSALALNTHVFSGSFAGSGAGALSGPAGVAVNDETGDVYVVDKGHNRVEEFDSTGSTLLSEFDGASAGHALSGPEGIAVDNSTNRCAIQRRSPTCSAR
jgi:DNA-binding beta-propeller fold protein YncE